MPRRSGSRLCDVEGQTSRQSDQSGWHTRGMTRWSENRRRPVVAPRFGMFYFLLFQKYFLSSKELSSNTRRLSNLMSAKANCPVFFDWSRGANQQKRAYFEPLVFYCAEPVGGARRP